MAIFDFISLLGQDAPGGALFGNARPDIYCSLDGIQFVIPPEDIQYNNTYRMTRKQTSAGQTLDKGGVGGCDITVMGIAMVGEDGWLRQIHDLLVTRASDAELMVWYDPIRNQSYEVACERDSLQLTVGREGLLVYTLQLVGQVLGLPWAEQTLVTVGTSDAVEAFDVASIGLALADVQGQTEMWAQYLEKSQPAAGGTQPPSSPGGN